jgi:hypothetical protein
VEQPARALGDGETLSLGEHSLRWFDTPHLPHAWECGFLMEERTKTLLCGDLFTQPGAGERPLVESDILGPSEAFRRDLDYYSHTKDGRDDRGLAAAGPTTLACMHGSACPRGASARPRRLAFALSHAPDSRDGHEHVTRHSHPHSSCSLMRCATGVSGAG